VELTKRIENMAKREGITYFGVATLSGAHDFILEQGGPAVGGFPISISLGLTLPKAIVDELPRRSDRAVALNYRCHAYEVINQRLDIIASLLSIFIQGKGHKVFPIPASAIIDDERICGSFSHKLAAYLSGLGWIGKSCLLITPTDGPRVRWTTILTDAPLVSYNKSIKEQCGDCNECVDVCPVEAFTGKPFHENEPREARFNARKCNEYFKAMEKSGKSRICGMCLYVCPHGR
jgi:epoxyqueuosine reductase